MSNYLLKQMLMKKIFTLIAMALTTMTASAKYQLSLTDLGNGWGSSYDAATKTITYDAGAWGGRGWGLLNWSQDEGVTSSTDYSAYDYVVVVIEPSDLKANLAVEYSDGVTLSADGPWLAGQNTGSYAVEPGGTLLAVKLDHTQKYLFQIYVQNQTWSNEINGNPGGTIKIVDAFMGTEAEYQDAVAGILPEIGQKQDLTLADLSTGWGGSTYDASAKSITIGEDWSGKGWWLQVWDNDRQDNVPADYSAFDKLAVEFAEPTAAQGNLVIEYANGTESNTYSFDAGATVAVVDLNPDGKTAVSQAYLQGPAGSVYTLAAAYFCTDEVAPEIPADPNADIVIWSETHKFDTWDSFTIAAEKFADVTAEDQIVFSISEAFDLPSWTYGGQVLIKKSDWSDDWAVNNNTENPALVAGTTNAEVVFTMGVADGQMLADVKANGMLVQGMGLTVSKVAIRKPVDAGMGQQVAAPVKATGIIYDLRGVAVGPNYRGLVAKDGKIYYQN